MECFEKGIITLEDTQGLDLSWGNYESMLTLIDQIAHRKGFGAVLADGVRVAADRIGKGAHKYAMHVKGLDVPAFDPRALRVYNFRYAIATRGADHLRISVHAAYALENLPTEEAAQKLKFWQDIVALPDIMGVCKFPYVFFSADAETTIKKALTLTTRIYNAATGFDLAEKDLMTVADRVAATERAVNAKLGITRKDDTLPRRFIEEPLTGGTKKGNVYDILEPMLDAFYKLNGWDLKTGVPRREALERLGLLDVAADLERRGILPKG